MRATGYCDGSRDMRRLPPIYNKLDSKVGADMRVITRSVEKVDVERVHAACLDRVVRYKLKGVWLDSFNEFPLPAQHTEKVCIDTDTDALFTQIPHHWQEMENEKYIVLLNDGLAVLKRVGAGFRYALIFLSASLRGHVPFIFEFSGESLRATGSWALPNIRPTEFYCEASAFTL